MGAVLLLASEPREAGAPPAATHVTPPPRAPGLAEARARHPGRAAWWPHSLPVFHAKATTYAASDFLLEVSRTPSVGMMGRGGLVC